jgi:transposase
MIPAPRSRSDRPTACTAFAAPQLQHFEHSFHFTPTSASWLNVVEGFFAKLTRRRLKRGAFKGIADLQAAINRFLQETNSNPKPFVWTADLDAIIEKVRRGKQVMYR